MGRKGKGRLEIVNQDNQDSSKVKAAKKNYEPNRRKFDNNARSRSRSPRIQRSPKRQRSTSRDRKRQRSRSPRDHKIISKDNYKNNDRRRSRSRSPKDHKIISKDNYKKNDSRRSRSRSPKDYKSSINQAVDRTITTGMIVDNPDLDHQKITKFPRKNIDMSEKDQDLVQRTPITHTKARINQEIDLVIVTIIEDSNCDFI